MHRAVAEQVEQLLVWDRAVRADAYDSVHQMRVTTRKIRSLLQDGFHKGPGSKAPTTVDAVIERISRARAVGYAVLVDEFDEDLAAVAAPVRDGYGRIVAALNISAPTSRLGKTLNGVGRQISQAAQYLGQALSSPPVPQSAASEDQHRSLPGLSSELRRIS